MKAGERRILHWRRANDKIRAMVVAPSASAVKVVYDAGVKGGALPASVRNGRPNRVAAPACTTDFALP